MKKAVPLALIALVGLTMSVSEAGEPQTFTIQAGAAATEPSFEHTRFYPHDVRVHRGDSVSWNIASPGPGLGFHTITFLPDGMQRPPLTRLDELDGHLNVPEPWFEGTGCGQSTQPHCVLEDTATIHSSGVPPVNPGGSFTATFDLPAGTYSYLCTVHVSMVGTVTVVDDTVDVPTQGQIDTLIATEVEADRLAALPLLSQDPGFVIEEGRRVYTVLLGDSTPDHHVAINGFIPASLPVRAGDAVEFRFDDAIVDEIHTVSFPEAAAGSFSPFPHGKGGFGFYFKCDPDDPFTGLPGTPCLPAQANELGLAPWMNTPDHALNDAVLTPATIHDSAILSPVGNGSYGEKPDGSRFPDRFFAQFPAPGTFSYICQVHMQPMTGSVTVT